MATVRKPLTAAQAWRRIAETLLTEERVSMGLCLEVSVLAFHGEITQRTKTAMIDRIKHYLKGRAWAYPPGEDVEARAMAALWLACESRAAERRR